MDAKTRKEIRRAINQGIQSNDQVRAKLFDFMRRAMIENPGTGLELFDCLQSEANAPVPFKTGTTQFGYAQVRLAVLKLGLSLVHEKVAEWFDEGVFEQNGGK